MAAAHHPGTLDEFRGSWRGQPAARPDARAAGGRVLAWECQPARGAVPAPRAVRGESGPVFAVRGVRIDGPRGGKGHLKGTSQAGVALDAIGFGMMDRAPPSSGGRRLQLDGVPGRRSRPAWWRSSRPRVRRREDRGRRVRRAPPGHAEGRPGPPHLRPGPRGLDEHPWRRAPRRDGARPVRRQRGAGLEAFPRRPWTRRHGATRTSRCSAWRGGAGPRATRCLPRRQGLFDLASPTCPTHECGARHRASSAGRPLPAFFGVAHPPLPGDDTRRYGVLPHSATP
jgi:hypothetical protein